MYNSLVENNINKANYKFSQAYIKVDMDVIITSCLIIFKVLR